jgi:hypothetical protein
MESPTLNVEPLNIYGLITIKAIPTTPSPTPARQADAQSGD